jgi:hypothetical protein
MADEHPVSSTAPSEVGVPVKDVDEKHVAVPGPRPTPSRGLSEWEAIQIAAAGDHDTIDREIGEIEASLQEMNIKSTWFKPQLKLKDPRHFTWLLVGKYSCDGHGYCLTAARFCIHGWSSIWCRPKFDQWC